MASQLEDFYHRHVLPHNVNCEQYPKVSDLVQQLLHMARTFSLLLLYYTLAVLLASAILSVTGKLGESSRLNPVH